MDRELRRGVVHRFDVPQHPVWERAGGSKDEEVAAVDAKAIRGQGRPGIRGAENAAGVPEWIVANPETTPGLTPSRCEHPGRLARQLLAIRNFRSVPNYHWVMPDLASLLDNNRQWAEGQTRRDPQFFERLCELQAPEYLWIGCADSRVPANEIVGLAPGELFVHRNLANVVAADDTNCLAVVQYAVEVLSVRHIIVCGHYGCGGVEAALSGGPLHGAAERWLQYIRNVRVAHTTELEQLTNSADRWRRLCELNVAWQVQAASRIPSIREAWHRGRPLAIHGWIYDLRNGLLRDLNVGTSTLAAERSSI